MAEFDTDNIQATFVEAERDGIKLAIKCRFLAVVALSSWYLWTRGSDKTPEIIAAVIVLLGLGAAHYRLVGTHFDRPWVKYLFITLDVVLLSVAIVWWSEMRALDMPPAIVFRFDLFDFYYVVLAVAAFSFSPRMVLWTGAISGAAWFGVFSWVVADMEHTLDWGDAIEDGSTETFLRVFFDPDFIATGSRLQEAVLMLVTAALLAFVMRRARRTVLLHLKADAERRSVSEVFGRYVPRAVADMVISDKGSLAPIERTATVLFVDVAGFTKLTERLGPVRVVEVLNEYFDAVTQVIAEHHGVVTQFQGDAVLATFNVPLIDEDHAKRAVECAIEILKTVDSTTFGGESIEVRIGINTGSLVAGNVGGGGRHNYTVHGNTVNLAARLEAMNKELDTRLLVSESTAQCLNWADLELVASVEVRGLSGSRPVFSFKGYL